MNVILQCRGLNLSWGWRDLVEAQFQTLNPLATVNAVRVVIEKGPRNPSTFRVIASLDVPGPDFRAEAKDYTLRAALVKVIGCLQKQIRSRKDRRKAKWRTNLHLSAPAGISHLSVSREQC